MNSLGNGRRGKTKAAFIIGLYIFFMLMDGLLTWLGTPDLSNEGNPLVSVFGLGWVALALANLLVLAGYAALVRYSFAVYTPPVVQVEGGRRHYYSQLLFHRPDRWLNGIRPRDWRALAAMAGYAFSYSAIASRVILVAEWLWYLTLGPYPAAYAALRRTVPFGRVDLLLGVVLAVWLLVWWIDRHYKWNLSALKAEGSRA